MARALITALDVGTSATQTVVAERIFEGDGDRLRVLGVGIVPSAGVRKGVVVDLDDAADVIRRSADEASRSAGVAIKSVWAAVGGARVSVASSRGVVAVSRADGEITREDQRRAIAAAETFLPRNPNRDTLHVIAREFRVDQEEGVRDPVGMHGVRLEVDALIIEIFAPALKNFLKCIESAGLRVTDYVFGPLAAAEAVLSKRQKELGVMLVDLGGGTGSFIVYEEGAPLHAGVLPFGGNHITNDIAIGFRTHVDVAEQVKLAYGSCMSEDLGKRDGIRAAEFVPDHPGVYSRRELAQIIQARLGDVFELIQKELKRINRKELLPSGVVLVGGGAGLSGLCDLARREIGLPVELGVPSGFEGLDLEYSRTLSTALGVVAWASNHGADRAPGWESNFSQFRQTAWFRWLRSLLP